MVITRVATVMDSVAIHQSSVFVMLVLTTGLYIVNGGSRGESKSGGTIGGAVNICYLTVG